MFDDLGGIARFKDLLGGVVQNALSARKIGDKVAEGWVDVNVDRVLVFDEDGDGSSVGNAGNLGQRHELHTTEEELLKELGLYAQEMSNVTLS